jgi:selenide, water dikinase
MAPDALAQVLRPFETMFPPERFPQLLVGLSRSDDAAVYRLGTDRALIATLDFITPIVDDPYTFGAIAAANSMSDIYAMGGEVAFALNICCLSDCLPLEVIAEILRGGAEKVAEAGGVIAGGHSVDDREPKYGLAVLGFVHPDRIWTKGGSRPGDVLVLTKPLGVGLITTVAKADEAQPEHVEAAVRSMLQLNRTAATLLQAGEVHACTDITGFGLLGHATELAGKGSVQIRFDLARLPLLPGAADYAETWLFPAGTGRNVQAYRDRVGFDPAIGEEIQQLLFTPETSGGLLAAVPPQRVSDLEAAFAAAGEPLWVVGEVAPAAAKLVSVYASPDTIAR